MSLDPYALCPCGSGKKLKFCCQDIVAEMEKVERLQENNQPRMALQLLDKMEKSHPGNAWIATNRGLALIHDNRPEEAKTSLAGFLRNSPKHPLANALFGLASLNADGYPECRKAVHRAFLRAFGGAEGRREQTGDRLGPGLILRRDIHRAASFGWPGLRSFDR